jgi:hypothetical protein
MRSDSIGGRNMKHHGAPGALLAALLCLFLPACGDSAQEPLNSSLENAVYAGEDAAGDWVTFAFTGEGALYCFSGAAAYGGSYEYGAGAGRVLALRAGNGETGPSPGAFTMDAGEKVMTFANYAGIQGERSFKRLRDTGAVDEEAPFSYAPLEAGSSIGGTVWAGTALRTKDWTTLTVTALDGESGIIQVSHSFDGTSNSRPYSGYAYGRETDLAYAGPFKIQGDIFRFLNFYGHGGALTLKRMR